ncbi:protein BPS1, chloroplastic-like [Cynara cardunculus var. scolymus]|uniref:protein BPS1, chloroplastic-like n=1 Tax=Cynara cardunculus var. scolymus TaxID=59895 RepID=UPI000D629E54|nr:protein BPS1, chloroplastic-like [Cynara cardunculus var. scolymus]
MLFHLQTLGFSHKLHNRHCRMSETSLRAFRLVVAGNLHQVLESLKLGSEILSLRWIHQCFQMLTIFNDAFAKLMVEIDYPVSEWEPGSIDEYFDYSINLLELLNSISSSLSHLNQHWVLLSHALRIMETSPDLAVERLKEIKYSHDSIKELTRARAGADGRHGKGNGKGRIFHEAILILKTTGFWVCGVVLSGLKSDNKPMMEINADSPLVALDLIFRKKMMEEGGLVKELERVNEIVRLITSSGSGNGNGNGDSDAAKELKAGLEVFGNGLKGLKEEEEGLFAEIMAARNEVLETLRRNNN